MKKLLATLATLFMVLGSTPVMATPDFGCYTAVIASPDVEGVFTRIKKYTTDYEIGLTDWSDLDAVLKQIAEKSNGQKVFLDFCVHGSDDGLWLQTPIFGIFMIQDRASFGYVLNRVDKYFPKHNFTLVFESCYPASAYKHTIRGAKQMKLGEKLEDYKGVPNFPVYGVGDGYSNIGPTMYIQAKYHFRKWWADLRDWDPKGKNKPLVKVQPAFFEEMNAMEEDILYTTEFFINHIP